MRLPRKTKKKAIKVFDRETYFGIINGFLTINKFRKGKGCIIKWTGKPECKLHSGAHHP